LLPSGIYVIRASTDRPELGYHFLPHNPTTTRVSQWEANKRLAFQLRSTLKDDERMIVFFKDNISAEMFADEMRCAVYHSKLPAFGNTKARNMHQWESGESKIIAGTTALIQGLDRMGVKFIVFYEGTFGLVTYQQGAGRAGRSGDHAYVFVVVNENHYQAFPKVMLSVNDPLASGACISSHNMY
jgi:superfamily II DNA helicase RecQ